MALTFELANIANYETLCYRTATVDNRPAGEVAGERYLTGTAQAVVFLTMYVGVNVLEGAKLEAFIERVLFFERLHGAQRRTLDAASNSFVDHPFTPNELRQFAGLRTNASAWTDAKFLANVYDGFKRSIARQLKA